MRKNRGVRRWAVGVLVFVTVTSAVAQGSDAHAGDSPIFKIDASFVWVPAVVQSESGATTKVVKADQFRLWDDGVEQKVVPVETNDLPVSLVILMQTGGSAGRFLSSYADLPTLLSRLTGTTTHEISFITFDSHIEQIWHFPNHSDGVVHALTHQRPGDSGAAIRDAAEFGVRQLQAEPGRFRRIVLLLSEAKDEGSVTSSQRSIEQLGMASTVVYSLVFPASKRAGRTKSPRSETRRGDKGSGGLDRAIRSMTADTAKEIATLTGGVSIKFNDRPSFNSGILQIAACIRDGYTLGFQPNQRTGGFHSIRVGLDEPSLTVNARTAYWSQSTSQLAPFQKP